MSDDPDKVMGTDYAREWSRLNAVVSALDDLVKNLRSAVTPRELEVHARMEEFMQEVRVLNHECIQLKQIRDGLLTENQLLRHVAREGRELLKKAGGSWSKPKKSRLARYRKSVAVALREGEEN